jgi:hypothetical protein
MTIAVETGSTMPFERFWRWLSEHPNCVLEAGTQDVALFDFEDFHWTFADDEEGRAIAQLVRGKNLVGELVVDRSLVLFVQGSPDPETADRGHWIFELMGGPRDDTRMLFYVVMSHGLDESTGHQSSLKH